MSMAKYTGSNTVMPGFGATFVPGSVYPKPKDCNPCFRFTNKSENECERLVVSNWWNEIICLYGQNVTYWQNPYSASTADNIYGEEPTKTFSNPQEIIIALELQENAVILQRYGFNSDDEVTAYIHISAFYDTFGDLEEPKAGDVFELTEYGMDRPGPRTGKKFEITERLDQDIARINPLAGHYVWLIKAKRYEYSFEPGLSSEGGNEQVYDDKFSGILSGGVSLSSAGKSYTGDVETDARDIFNYEGFNYDDVYGGYGNTDEPS
jgi:hypothetical protein